MMKKLAACLLVLVVAVAFMPASAFAASKSVSMTAYSQVYKTKHYAYCAGAAALYKVKVSNGKVVSKKKLVKSDMCFSTYSYFEAMKKKGKYLYYRLGSEGTVGTICRVNVSTGKDKSLAQTGYGADYAIKDKRIYYYKYTENSYGEPKMLKRHMKLNGKDKKKAAKKAVLTEKKSNKSGYRMIIKKKGSYVKDYLKTPKGTYYLGKIRCEY